MPILKCKLGQMSLKVVQSKEEFDLISSDRTDGESDVVKKREKQREGDKIIPRCGYITKNELIQKTMSFQSHEYPMNCHGYIRTLNPNGPYQSLKENTLNVSRQLIQDLKKKNYLVLSQSSGIQFIKNRVEKLMIKFGQSSIDQIVCQIFSAQSIFPGTTRQQIRNVLADIYQDWIRQTSLTNHLIDKTVNIKNKSFTSMSHFQRPFKTRLKVKFNFQLKFLQNALKYPNNTSASNLAEICHNLRQDLQKEKQQSEFFQDKLFTYGNKLGFQLSQELSNVYFRQSDHSNSSQYEEMSSNQFRLKKKRKAKKITYKRKYHHKKEKKLVKIHYQIKQSSSKIQIKTSKCQSKDSQNSQTKDKIKISVQSKQQNSLLENKKKLKQENLIKLKSSVDNLQQLIVPKQNIFSYFNKGYKRKVKKDDNFLNCPKKVIKVENNFFIGKYSNPNKNWTKQDEYNSSVQTYYHNSKDFSIYDSQQDNIKIKC